MVEEKMKEENFQKGNIFSFYLYLINIMILFNNILNYIVIFGFIMFNRFSIINEFSYVV